MLRIKAEALSQKKRELRGRRLIAVDIENIVGGGVRDIETANKAWATVDRMVGRRNTDQVVIGASHFSALPSLLARPNARLVMQSGPDGADLALIDVLESEHIAERFDEVVLLSGDAIFAETVSMLSLAGVKVTVAAGKSKLSRRLRMAADSFLTWAEVEVGFGDVA